MNPLVMQLSLLDPLPPVERVRGESQVRESCIPEIDVGDHSTHETTNKPVQSVTCKYANTSCPISRSTLKAVCAHGLKTFP